jgi:hypothetical protein
MVLSTQRRSRAQNLPSLRFTADKNRMATLLPTLPSCARRMTPGELRFAQRLLEKLDDDYCCWYDVPLGPGQHHPDFVILHPRRGILALEVRGWTLDQLGETTRATVTLLTPQGAEQTLNPLEQARLYALCVVDLLEKDPVLRAPGGPYRDGLMVPWGYGCVLTRITRRDFEAAGLHEVIDPGLVICQDEMIEAIDAARFQSRLWAMLRVASAAALTMAQIDRIRWHLFPEIHLSPGQESLFAPPARPAADQAERAPHMLRVMDLKQEGLARSLGEGHRVIHGVAGSGKTMILSFRAARLAREIDKPILVLCYNVALSAKLQHVVAARGLSERVAVHHFHGWCSDQIKRHNVPRPEAGERFLERLVAAVIEGVERSQIPRAQYGAVMIDEGHDFAPEWLALAVQMVDPVTNSFLMLYDDAQSIYGRRRGLPFALASVGIQAKGRRTTVLGVNYRNSSPVLKLACEFAHEILAPGAAEDDEMPLVLPESAGRHGPAPEIVLLPNLKSEVNTIASRLRAWHEHGRSWNEMAVVYRTHFIGDEVVAGLEAAGVPVEWLHRDKSSRHFRPAADSVKVMTMHSSKGLEFPIVAIPGLGFMPHVDEDPRAEARLLYIAMTRAMENLLMTGHRQSDFVARLMRAAEGSRAA